MAFNPNIKYDNNLSVKENVKAMINWLNFVCKEMTIGRVVLLQEKSSELETENETLKATQEENDADLLYQVCLLQLGVTEEDL